MELDELESSIEKDLGSLGSSAAYNKQSIYNVPQHFRKGNEECYSPTEFSIGPIHYGDLSLEPMQELKLRHLQYFLLHGNQAYSLRDYITMLADSETKARSYYVEIKNKKGDVEFVKTMLIDSAFIIIWFLHYSVDLKDIVTLKAELKPLLEKDLFVMENQLPFFILNDLYNACFGDIFPHLSFIDVTCRFINSWYIPGKDAAETLRCKKLLNESNIDHLVDFLRICCLPPKLREDGDESLLEETTSPEGLWTATELKAAGVRFVASKSTNLLDVRFSDGVLEMPTFVISSRTEAICRNLLFFEHTHCSSNKYLVDYFHFLDALLHTPEDLSILVKAKIIIHNLGGGEGVVNVFTSIRKHTFIRVTRYYYAPVSRDLYAYTNTSSNRWMAILRRDYFCHPWAAISVIYALVLLILTILQVITGFMGLSKA